MRICIAISTIVILVHLVLRHQRLRADHRGVQGGGGQRVRTERRPGLLQGQPAADEGQVSY